MKKITFLWFAALFAFSMQAQINYPATMPELLKGKTVKVISTKTSGSTGYTDFFTNLTPKERQVYKPIKEFSRYTAEENLKGLTFNVTEVEKILIFGEPKTRLTLQGANNLKLYYLYDEKFDYYYPFEVIGGLTVPDDFYCLEKTVTKGETLTVEEVATGNGSFVAKDSMDGVVKYRLYLITFGSKMVKPVKQLTLVLEKGETIIIKNTSVTPEYQNATTFRYKMMVGNINGELLAKLKAKKITGVIVDGFEMPIETGQKIQGAINCLFR